MDKPADHIGQRLKSIRELRGFTQQQLELELDASFGHISKIESGKTNPTKETLLAIADILKLNTNETIVLLGLKTEPVTQEQVAKVIEYTGQYLSSTPNPAYLADDFWFIWTGNDRLLDVFGLPQDKDIRASFLQKMRGRNILVWLFSDQLCLRNLLAQDTWEKTVYSQCFFFILKTDYLVRQSQPWAIELLHKLQTLPDFTRIWTQVLDQVKQGCYKRPDLTITFQDGNKTTTFFMGELQVNSMPRFHVVEYHPHNAG